MSNGQAIALVARREIVERVRDRSFTVSTAITVLMIAAFVIGPRLLGFNDPDHYRVAALGDTAAIVEAAAQQAPAFNAQIEQVEVADLAAAEAALRAEELDVAITGDTLTPELVVAERMPDELAALLQRAAADVAVMQRLAEAGVPPEDAAQILQPAPPPIRTLEESRGGSGLGGLAFFVTFLLYGQLFGYGMAVASGVVEEKQTRVVEVLLSKLRPSQLLAGKILGIGVVGLLQLLLIAAVGLALVVVTGTVELPPGAAPAIAAALAWYVLGYAFYACAFAGAGALVSRQEELQNAITPLMLIVFAALFLAFAALNDPTGTLARVASFVPLTAPMVMAVRMTLGEALAWEVGLAVALMVVAIVAMVALAARVYAGAVLQTGARVSLRDAFRAAAPARNLST